MPHQADLQERILDHLQSITAGTRSPAVESDVSIASKMVNVDPSDLGSTAGVVNEGTVERQGDSCDTSVASSKIVHVDANSERDGVSILPLNHPKCFVVKRGLTTIV